MHAGGVRYCWRSEISKVFSLFWVTIEKLFGELSWILSNVWKIGTRPSRSKFFSRQCFPRILISLKSVEMKLLLIMKICSWYSSSLKRDARCHMADIFYIWLMGFRGGRVMTWKIWNFMKIFRLTHFYTLILRDFPLCFHFTINSYFAFYQNAARYNPPRPHGMLCRF